MQRMVDVIFLASHVGVIVSASVKTSIRCYVLQKNTVMKVGN